MHTMRDMIMEREQQSDIENANTEDTWAICVNSFNITLSRHCL